MSGKGQRRVAGERAVHFFRHGFAHVALDAGLDVSHEAQPLGHEDIETTMRYVREHPTRLRDLQW